jgi:Carbohydrate family 9 binding domain-like
MRASVVAFVLCLMVCGCTERKPHASARREDVLLKAAPAPKHPLDVSFDDKVDLLGYDLEPEHPVPGQPFTVTWYWRVRAPLGKGVQLFTHVADGSGATQLNLDAQRPLRSAYPEAEWKAGDYIRDAQSVTIPEAWAPPTATFYLGFYVGSRRFDVTRGKHDAERRAEALRLPMIAGLTPAAPEPPLPELKAVHTRGKIRIDGKFDEADWKSAAETGPMVQTRSGAPGEFTASARLLWDEANLYIAFSVADDYLKSTFDHDDDHLWEQDTVEIMFDPDADGRNYFELQVSPRSVHFDTRYDARRNPRPFGHVDWDSRVQAKAIAQGTVNDEAEDKGYDVEMAIPWTAFATGDPPAKPPSAGTTWRINFFVMDARERGQRAVGWSPPRVGDFHILEKFGRVQFSQ